MLKNKTTEDLIKL